MLRRSLQRARPPHLLLVAVASVSCGAVPLGCNSSPEGSSTGYLGYIFSQAFEDEVRLLHLPTTPEFTTRCYFQELPPAGDIVWRETQLDPVVHGVVAGLIEDEESWEAYETDTDASKGHDRVCIERTGESDLCYPPELTVSRFNAFLWNFWLGPEVTLSPQSLALAEAFLVAHEECWTKGTPAPGYGVGD